MRPLAFKSTLNISKTTAMVGMTVSDGGVYDTSCDHPYEIAEVKCLYSHHNQVPAEDCSD